MSAKLLRCQPIDQRRANRLVKRLHYSGSSVQNSQLHVGVFYKGSLEGVMQLGPPMVKRRALPLVPGTPWNGMLELNRMAFSDKLPRNSESRALGVLFRMLRKHKPAVQWVQSYADATQCGDGTIYRAAGFLLVQVRKNTTIYEVVGTEKKFTDIGYRTGSGVRGEVLGLLPGQTFCQITATKGKHAAERNGRASISGLLRAGKVRVLPGFQVRYIKFLSEEARERLAVDPLPYSSLVDLGATMYRGKRAGPKLGPRDQPRNDGALPIPALFPALLPPGSACGDG